MKKEKSSILEANLMIEETECCKKKDYKETEEYKN